MVGEASTSTVHHVGREWVWRGTLLLLLFPMGLAAVCLARMPSYTTTYGISEDKEFVLTGSHWSIEDEAAEFRVLSLRTGKSTRLDARGVVDISHGNLHWCESVSGRMHAKVLDLDSFRETHLGSFDSAPYEPGPCSYVEPGIVAMVDKQNQLCAIDVRTGDVSSHALPPLSSTQNHFWLPLWRESPPRLVVAEVANAASTGRDRMLLFSYVDGKLQQLAQWTANMVPRVANENLISLTVDHRLEIRRMSDGSLVQTQSLAHFLNPPVTATVWPRTVWVTDVDSNFVGLTVRPNLHFVYDTEQKNVVFQNASLSRVCRDVRFDTALFMDNQAVEIWRFADDKLVRRFDFAMPVRDVQFKEDGSQVLVLLQDESVHVHDTSTGRWIRTYRSRSWVLPTFLLLVIGFCFWTWLWIYRGVKDGLHPFWDILILNGLVLAGLLLRVFLEGSLKDSNRVIYGIVQALGANWLLLIMFWFVFAQRRWSVKILAPLVGLGGAIGLAQLVYRGDRQPIWELLVGASGVMALLAAMLGMARRRGWQLLNVGTQAVQIPFRKSDMRIPLRDIFLVITAAGILFAAIRYVPAGRFDLQSAGTVALLAVTTTVVAIVGAWTALSPRSAWIRILGLACAIVSAGSLHSLLFPVFFNLYSWTWHLRFAALVAIFTCGSLWTLRARGWRLWRFSVPALAP